jgi:hypothetical protein
MYVWQEFCYVAVNFEYYETSDFVIRYTWRLANSLRLVRILKHYFQVICYFFAVLTSSLHFSPLCCLASVYSACHTAEFPEHHARS